MIEGATINTNISTLQTDLDVVEYAYRRYYSRERKYIENIYVEAGWRYFYVLSQQSSTGLSGWYQIGILEIHNNLESSGTQEFNETILHQNLQNSNEGYTWSFNDASNVHMMRVEANLNAYVSLMLLQINAVS